MSNKATAGNRERDLVRDLGRQAQALATSPEYAARVQRWCDVNARRKPDRPPVWCKPIGCWSELLPETELQCTDPWLRNFERAFRRQLIKQQIGDDSLILPYWPVSAAIRSQNKHVWGVEVGHHAPSSAGGAWGYDPPLKAPEEVTRLQKPVFVHDRAATEQELQRASELLDGVMPVRVTAGLPLDPNIGCTAAELLGLDNLMLQLAMDPDSMHRFFAFLRDSVLASMDQVEAMGVLTENNTGEMYTSDSLKKTPPHVPVRISDLWGMTNSQEFDQVSPDMWNEFLLAYQKPILARFGLTAYGCCENLTQKIDGVLTIPNLRIFVCSAWSDLGKIVDAAGKKHTIMWRQKASDVVFTRDIGTIRTHLQEGVRRLQGCRFQIVLRELQTLNGNLRRLHEWTALAKEAAERA